MSESTPITTGAPNVNAHLGWTPKPMALSDGPLVWIDCEMTGLDPRKDRILEIAVIITNGNLEPVDEGIQFVVKTPKEVLDRMDEWCVNQHGKSGLTQACIHSPHSHAFVEDAVLSYIKKWIPRQRSGVLAGNSVHADRGFLANEMPTITDWLHYRIVDVSSIKELCRRWYPGFTPASNTENNKDAHRALSDIQWSIKELQWYRDNIFVSPLNIAPLLEGGAGARSRPSSPVRSS